ncbi:MAG: ribonuclease P protein component [Nitrosomonadales bacterium]|nr:MAG: ribonuclease P protein component [Nitrosomonadales bacterium]
MPKSHRLHNAKEFSSVIQFRCSESSEFLQIFAKPNDLIYSRLGLIVAGKIERLAVKRNRAKRVLRALFREKQQDLAGLDFVVRLRRPVARADSSRLKDEGKALIIKLQRCCG